MRLFAKASGPFNMAKELSNVMEPKAKSKANFCGEMGSKGRKEKEKEMSMTPTKKTAANCASFAGDMASAERPDRPCVTLPALAAAAAFTEPAAAVAFSLAACAWAAPTALASDNFFWLLLCKSLAICCAFLPFSDRAAVACEAPSATLPKLCVTPLCRPLACSLQSADVAFSAAWATPRRAPFVALATCFFARLAAALAHAAQWGCASPASTSRCSSAGSAACACGTAS
mmetsp:Transcript_86254/g.279239  ORF Transcript_86254/g.279239 Transcript_86254/m.279239 type:complete len:230 (-) Transcript_86254:303-992(-)